MIETTPLSKPDVAAPDEGSDASGVAGETLMRLFASVRDRMLDAGSDTDAQTPYRAFLDALAVAVYTTDAAGRITFFNEAAVELWGRRPEIGEEWCGSLRLFHLDGRPMAHDECPMAIALKEQRPVRGEVAYAERPDGRRVAFTPYPTPLRDANGTMIGAVNVMVDVTERIEAERSLQTSGDALRASNAVKDEFLGLISHELRTPVTTIFGNATLLYDRAELGERERAMVSDIVGDSDRLLRIVENLLQLTRLGSGTELELEPQVLDRVVNRAVGSYRRRHPRRDVRLATLPPSTVVDADATAIELLVENLLSNADKYSPLDEPIDVVIESREGEARVHVLDRGIGIDAEDAGDVFTTFFRTDAARRVASGMGVGLSVCKRIAEAQGGRIWAAPRDGGGSDVGFALPLSSDHEDASTNR
ncbi:MAG TPA: ATP-binding protein [Candidatus Limnocylindrales bacterium]|nr:ATP-binding protein [Candidatus Limnocylindrales bacterium]